MHCDHTVHVNPDLSSSLHSPCCGYTDTKECPPAANCLFSRSTWKRGGVCMCKSQERLKIEIKLLLSANGKSYMPRRLAQQRMTLSDLE